MNKEQWTTIFEGQKKSGLSVSKYCKEHKPAESAFYCARGRRKEQVEPALEEPAFSKIVIPNEKVSFNAAGMQLQLTVKELASLIKELK